MGNTLKGEIREIAEVNRMMIASSTITSVLKQGTKQIPKFWTNELMVDGVMLIDKYYYTVMVSSPIIVSPPIKKDIPMETRCSVCRNRLKLPKMSRNKLLRLLSEKTYSKEEEEKVLRTLLEYMVEPLIKEKAEDMARAHARRIGSSEEAARRAHIKQIFDETQATGWAVMIPEKRRPTTYNVRGNNIRHGTMPEGPVRKRNDTQRS